MMDLHVSKSRHRMGVIQNAAGLSLIGAGKNAVEVLLNAVAQKAAPLILGSLVLGGLHAVSPANAGDFTLDWGGAHTWPGTSTNPPLFTMTDQYGFQLDALAATSLINSTWNFGAPNQTNNFGTITTIRHANTPFAGFSGIGESTITTGLSFSSNGTAFGVDSLAFQITDIDAVDGNTAGFNGDRCDLITATGNVGNPALTFISPTVATRSVIIGPGAGSGATGPLAANQAQCIFNTSTAVSSPTSGADDNGSILATFPAGTSSVTILYDESIENVAGLTSLSAAGRGIGTWGAVAIVVNQSISLVKTADITSYSTIGQVITYTYTITNDGPLPINTGQNIRIDDDQIGEFTCGTVGAEIPQSGTHICTAAYTVTAADMAAPSVVNVATAGVGTGAQTFATRLQSNSDTQTVVRELPVLALTKSAASPTTAGGGSPTLTDGGDTITYSYTVNNTGNVTVSSVTISDPGPSFNGTAGSGTLSAFSPASATIPASGSQVFTAIYTLSQADVDNAATITNGVTNTAAANGTAPSSAAVASNDSSASTTIGGGPSLAVTKSANDTTDVIAGQVILYTYTVNNDGNQTISSLSLADIHDGSGPTPVPANETLTTDNNPLGDSGDGSLDGTWDTLAPGDTVTFTATYQVTQNDVDTKQ